MKWIEIARAILELLPLVFGAIRTVEEQFGPGNGELKKAVVLNAINTPETPQEAVNAAASVIDSAVGGLNKVGVFKRSK